MKAILQRVKCASVSVKQDDQELIVGEIGFGWLVLLGVAQSDQSEDALKLANKCANLRGLPDHTQVDGKISKSIVDLEGGMLIVSQFTLYAQTSKGRRPSFNQASKGVHARSIYEEYCRQLKESGVKQVEQGAFGEEMSIASDCWGPITYTIEV